MTKEEAAALYSRNHCTGEIDGWRMVDDDEFLRDGDMIINNRANGFTPQTASISRLLMQTYHSMAFYHHIFTTSAKVIGKMRPMDPFLFLAGSPSCERAIKEGMGLGFKSPTFSIWRPRIRIKKHAWQYESLPLPL